MQIAHLTRKTNAHLHQGKAIFFVSDVAAGLSLRKRAIDSLPESYGNKMQTMSMRRRATGEAFASA
ncbi:hypothetical protein [Methylocystis sp. SC2]|uniref:hypothetical protein n=1 Tax=Methylocystis sp. (strain SC2) TaxID=187303 RepID=UPI0002F8790C|nr:hypothetical protein [Methylocystis sp. SC2]